MTGLYGVNFQGGDVVKRQQHLSHFALRRRFKPGPRGDLAAPAAASSAAAGARACAALAHVPHAAPRAAGAPSRPCAELHRLNWEPACVRDNGCLPALPGVRVRLECFHGAYDRRSLCPQVDTAEQSRPASSRDEEPFAGGQPRSSIGRAEVGGPVRLWLMRQEHLGQCCPCVDACKGTEQCCAHALRCINVP